jgi:hypothetical protein
MKAKLTQRFVEDSIARFLAFAYRTMAGAHGDQIPS